MQYEDLLNAPYKTLGRGDGGYDCYGVVIECCKRAGTPLRDLALRSLCAQEVAHYIHEGLNVREVPQAREGGIAYFLYAGNAHIGYIVDRQQVIHATARGVRITPLYAMKALAFYEVLP